MGKYLGTTADGRDVEDRSFGPSHNKVGDLELLREALSRVRFEGDERITREVDFGFVVGKDPLVPVFEGDPIVVTKQRGRHQLTRCAVEGKPSPTTIITIVLQPNGPKRAWLLSAWYGPSKKIRPNPATGELVEHLVLAPYVPGRFVEFAIA